MANVFGHREEAEAFRSRLLEAGHASYEAQVNQAIAEFDAILVQRDWARESTVPGLAEILAQHGGGSGIAFAWEMQLLAATTGGA